MVLNEANKVKNAIINAIGALGISKNVVTSP